ETSLEADELLIAVEIPVLTKWQRAAYVKFQTHERPTLGLALVLDVEDGGQIIKKARAVVGSVSPMPSRSDTTDSALVGPPGQAERQLNQAAEALARAADPIDDLQGSAEYKRHLIGVFLRRALTQALS
ncbi:MAG TPA: hypothetical protein VLD83_14470, partial [Candidatus Binatia bacterium]|nr:hypothetical protein [Candidatus Binatia bacterium]